MARQRRATPDLGRYDGGSAGRLLGILYVLSGLVTLASPLLPTPDGFHTAGVVWVGAAATGAGLITLALPWARWSRRAPLLLIPPAFALIAVHNITGGADPYRYGLFFFIAFVFIGVTQDRGFAALAAAPATVAYLVPLLLAEAPASSLASAAYAVPIFVGVGETLAWRSERLRCAEQRLHEMAYTDALTGLVNRPMFVERVTAALAERADRDRVWVLFADLDGFKPVNDRWGHDAGDRLLRAVAEAIRSCLPAGALPCRWAGDEFTVLLPDTSCEQAEETARAVERAVSGVEASCGARVGVTVGCAGAGATDTAEALIAAADAVMYARKRSLDVPAPRGSGDVDRRTAPAAS